MIRRLWKREYATSTSDPTSESKRTIWDMGNEVWEMYEDEIRHFQIHSREFIQENLVEIVSLLPESPIPLEAVENDVGSGWSVLEEVIPKPCENQRLSSPDEKPLKHVKVSSAAASSRKKSAPRQGSSLRSPQAPPQQQQEEKEQGQEQARQNKSRKTSSENCSYSSSQPSESEKHLWSSLSQWIPAYALYQPSLHSQAILEMTEKTVHIHLSPKQYKPKIRLSGPSFL